jgi:hypothetical protein
MSFERPVGPAAEPAPVPVPSSGPAADEVSPAMRLQILSTEHWSLLASRSLAWNESFSRGGMFLATLSGAIVSLALVAQATEFGEGFRIFGLVILPVVLFVGIGTNLRMGISNYHDALCVQGMNRIRAGYLEIAPDLERFFVMGSTDDERGIQLTQAMLPGTPMIVQMLASSPMLISVLNSVLIGAIVALVTLQVGGGTSVAVLASVLAFTVGMAASLAYARREMSAVHAGFEPRFPTKAPTDAL